MKGGPKTREEAMALPEVQQTAEFFLGGGGIDGNAIFVFVDADGFSKRVECIRRAKDGPDEWVKTPFKARLAYMGLWDDINAKRGLGWDRNPWVWVIEFKRNTKGDPHGNQW